MGAGSEAGRGEAPRERGAERPRELHRQLARERARNAGLEHGIAALEHRVRMLSAELKNLRRHGR
ncbi:MAG: hypothetical protein JWQ20_3805 [Conexibacter sp.]|jgi:chromosome condensin MukBEF ATPase and DNA-binding subunit MukB|nr:hypothetical protein [Conexibacter sp.]